MIGETKKPEWITEGELKDVLDFLDELRETAITNMLATMPHIKAFWFESKNVRLNDGQAREILVYWMRTFGTRQAQ